jgi:hypothetical protein
MVCFQTKNPNLCKFWRVLRWKMLLYFMNTWSTYFTVFYYILWTFGIVRGNLVYFFPFWYIVTQNTEKSGNPALHEKTLSSW